MNACSFHLSARRACVFVFPCLTPVGRSDDRIALSALAEFSGDTEICKLHAPLLRTENVGTWREQEKQRGGRAVVCEDRAALSTALPLPTVGPACRANNCAGVEAPRGGAGVPEQGKRHAAAAELLLHPRLADAAAPAPGQRPRRGAEAASEKGRRGRTIDETDLSLACIWPGQAAVCGWDWPTPAIGASLLAE